MYQNCKPMILNWGLICYFIPSKSDGSFGGDVISIDYVIQHKIGNRYTPRK